MAELARDPAFQRACVAVGYVLGQRGSALLDPLPQRAPEAERLVLALGMGERQQRAEILARELALLSALLEARRYR